MTDEQFELKYAAIQTRLKVATAKRDKLANSHARWAQKVRFLFEKLSKIRVKAFVASTGIRIKSLVEYEARVYRVDALTLEGDTLAIYLRERDNPDNVIKVTDPQLLKRFQKPAAAEPAAPANNESV